MGYVSQRISRIISTDRFLQKLTMTFAVVGCPPHVYSGSHYEEGYVLLIKYSVMMNVSGVREATLFRDNRVWWQIRLAIKTSDSFAEAAGG